MKANRLIFYAFMFHIYLWLVQQITRFSCTKRQRRRPTHDDPEHPHPPLSAAAAKLELTFLKLNESAVSGKWISNIWLKNILQKNEKKNQRKKEKDGGETNCRDKIKICQRLPATPTAP